MRKPSDFSVLQNATHSLWCAINIDSLQLTLMGRVTKISCKTPLFLAYIMAARHRDTSICQNELEMLKFNLSTSGAANLSESTFLSKSLAQPNAVAHSEAYLPNQLRISANYSINEWTAQSLRGSVVNFPRIRRLSPLRIPM